MFLLKTSWENLCKDAGILKTFQIAGYILFLIKVFVPVILIVIGSLELGKAVIANDDKAIKVAVSSLAKRAIAGVVIFFIPTILSFAMSLVEGVDELNDGSYEKCSKCISSPSNCDINDSDLFN